MNCIVLDNFVLTSELFPRFTLQRADRFCTTKPSPTTVGVGDGIITNGMGESPHNFEIHVTQSSRSNDKELFGNVWVLLRS